MKKPIFVIPPKSATSGYACTLINAQPTPPINNKTFSIVKEEKNGIMINIKGRNTSPMSIVLPFPSLEPTNPAGLANTIYESLKYHNVYTASPTVSPNLSDEYIH